MATAQMDDYIPNLEEDFQQLQNSKPHPFYHYENYRQTQPAGLIPMMLRMIGFNEQKLGMMALNMLVYLAEYIAKNVLGMESEFQNELSQYRSIVNEEGVLAGLFKLVQDSSTKSEKIKKNLLNPSITENVRDIWKILLPGD